MMLSSLLLALLVGISERCTSDGNVFSIGEYAEAVRKAGMTPVVICRTADDRSMDEALAPLDLLIMQGGEDVDPARYGERPSPKLGKVNHVRDAFEERLFRAAVRRELPVFGTCRGMQHVNVLLGGTLHQDLPSELKSYTVEHRTGKDKAAAYREFRHRLAIVPGSRLAAIAGTDSATVNSLHHQAVKRLAPGLRVTGRTADGIIEAVECDWYPLVAVQFHPEALSVARDDAFCNAIYRELPRLVGRANRTPVADRPIGVFDSGTGGLTVLEKLLSLDAFDNATGAEGSDGIPDFAAEDFVYLGDQANMPYGVYDAAGKADFLRELVVRDAQFVLGSEGHAPSKIVVIACNTATAYGLEALQAMPRPHDAKVIGVVNAGVEAALDAIEAKDDASFAIGVIATPGTIASGAYERTIRASLAARGIKSHVEVANRGGIGLAEAVENDEPGVADCARTNLIALVEGYRASGATAPLRAIIMGCTHYPFVIGTFKETLENLRTDPKYAKLIAADLQFVDPAIYTAIACYRALKADGILKAKCEGEGRRAKRVQSFISVGKAGPLSREVKYGRELGCEDLGTKIVPMTSATMTPEALERLGKLLPLTHRSLRAD